MCFFYLMNLQESINKQQNKTEQNTKYLNK